MSQRNKQLIKKRSLPRIIHYCSRLGVSRWLNSREIERIESAILKVIRSNLQRCKVNSSKSYRTSDTEIKHVSIGLLGFVLKNSHSNSNLSKPDKRTIQPISSDKSWPKPLLIEFRGSIWSMSPDLSRHNWLKGRRDKERGDCGKPREPRKMAWKPQHYSNVGKGGKFQTMGTDSWIYFD